MGEDPGVEGGRMWAALVRVLEDPDRGIKLDPYARRGIRQYWIVDPVEDAVDVWRFGDEPGHERFSGELPVRLGAERVGRTDLGEVFSRHLDLWEPREE